MLYEVISDVIIRKGPKIVEYQDPKTKQFITNAIGKLTVGTRREVYSTTTNNNNETWGRISESDAAGVAEWVCIKNMNRTFMKSIEVQEDYIETRLSNLEKWGKMIEERVAKLENMGKNTRI